MMPPAQSDGALKGLVSGPRYPGDQDSNEEGLSLLRWQFQAAGNPHLNWTEQPGKVTRGNIEVLGGEAQICIFGEARKCSALATLICRAVSLGRLMMDELEPANESDLQDETSAGGPL